jgi:hypothetical protein
MYMDTTLKLLKENLPDHLLAEPIEDGSAEIHRIHGAPTPLTRLLRAPAAQSRKIHGTGLIHQHPKGDEHCKYKN